MHCVHSRKIEWLFGGLSLIAMSKEHKEVIARIVFLEKTGDKGLVST